MIRIVHVNDELLAPLRARYGDPVELEWAGEITEREHALATYNPHTSSRRARTTSSSCRETRRRSQGRAGGGWTNSPARYAKRLLETGQALWRYRVALHDAALTALHG